MTTLKYVIVEVQTICGGMETGVIFSELMTHKHVATSLGEPISAGVCWQEDNGQWKVGGQSDSLGLKSREEDAVILNSIYIETMADEFADMFGPELLDTDEVDIYLSDMDEFLESRLHTCVPDRADAELWCDNGETFEMVYTFGDRSQVTIEIEYGNIVGWRIG